MVIDYLKLPNEASCADPRSKHIGRNSVEDQYKLISPFTLIDMVPENIIQHYEIGRNLYLYGFYMFRFYMVAQHHVLITLEYAVKHKVGKKKIQKFGEKRNLGKGLKACIAYLKEHELVLNSDFPLWQHRRKNNAESQFREEKYQEMISKNLSCIEFDDDYIDIELYPFNWDYLSILENSLPSIRNEHAHGSSMLDHQVLKTFENVSVIINNLYK